MTLTRTSTLWFLVMLGCGPRVGVALDDVGSDDSAGEHDATGDSSAGMDGDGSTPTDTSTDPTSTDPTSTICGADRAETPLAVLSSGDGMAVLNGDGTTVALELPPPSLVLDSSAVTIHARGAYVAVATAWSSFANGAHYHSDLSLMHATGGLAWTLAQPQAFVAVPLLGVDGSIVAGLALENSETQAALYRDAVATLVIPGFSPWGPLAAGGFVPGAWYPADGLTHNGWFSSVDGSVQEAEFTTSGPSFVTSSAELIHLGQGEAGWSLFTQSPAGVNAVPVAGLDGAEPATVTSSASPSWKWLLARAGDSGPWLRISVADGHSEPVDLTLPSGLSAFECYGPDLRIDDAGGVLVAARDATATRMLRFDPSTTTWTTLGQPVTLVEDIEVSTYGETYVVRTAGQGTTFCPPQDYEPSDTPLVGATLQIVRPVDDAALDATDLDGWPTPSPDGACVAMTGVDGVTVHDLRTGLALELTGVTGVTWWSPDAR